VHLQANCASSDRLHAATTARTGAMTEAARASSSTGDLLQSWSRRLAVSAVHRNASDLHDLKGSSSIKFRYMAQLSAEHFGSASKGTYL